MRLKRNTNIIKIAILLAVFLVNVSSNVMLAKNAFYISGNLKSLSITKQLEFSNILLQPIIENEEDETSNIFIPAYLSINNIEEITSYNFTLYFEKLTYFSMDPIWRRNRNLRL